MARFKPRSPQDLQMLKMGMCPECGAQVQAGVVACPSCRIEYGEYAAQIPAPAAPAPRPAAPAAPASAPRPAAAAPVAAAPVARGAALTERDIEELERGHAARILPLSTASEPEAFALLAGHGVSMAQALVVLADAALVDTPDVLENLGAPPTHIPRAMPHAAKSSWVTVDDAPTPLAWFPPTRLFEGHSEGPPAPAHRHIPTIEAVPNTAPDADATMMHDAAAIAAVAAQLQRQQQQQAQHQGSSTPIISARGKAALIDD